MSNQTNCTQGRVLRGGNGMLQNLNLFHLKYAIMETRLG